MHKKAYQRYTQEFKEQAIGLLNFGKPVAEVAQELEVSSSVLYEWRSKAQVTQGGSAGLRAAGEQSEVDALRDLRRQARLQAENDILKKAAIILGTKTPGNSAP